MHAVILAYRLQIASRFVFSSFKDGPHADHLHHDPKQLQYGDREAADHYKQEYLQTGGKLQGIRKSIDKAHPLGLLPDNMRYKFRQSLRPEEERAFKDGLNWYKETYRP